MPKKRRQHSSQSQNNNGNHSKSNMDETPPPYLGINTENFTKMIASYLNIPHDHTKNIIFNLVNSDKIFKFRLKNSRKIDRKSLNLLRNQEIQAVII